MQAIGTLFAVVLALLGPASADGPKKVALRPGDKIVAIGASITQAGGWLRDIDAVLAQQYPELKIPPIVNKGIGGQKAADLVRRFDKDVVKAKPAVVLINVGINDVWHCLNKPDDPKNLATFKKSIAQIVAQAQQAGIHVVLLSPTIIQEDANSEGNKRLVAYVNAERQIAAAQKCQFVDLHAMLLKALQKKPAGVERWLTVDGVHMRPIGDAMLAVGALRALGIPDAKIAASTPPK
jgi:lysophospholipase L1-like esterase